MAVALAPGDPIPWADPELAAALKALRELPGGAEVYDQIGCEYVAALHLTAAELDAERALETIRETSEWRQSSGAAAARLRLSSEELEFKDYPHCADIMQHMPMKEGPRVVTHAGLPIGVRCIGMVDTESLFEKLTQEQLLEWQLFVSEGRLQRLEAYARQTGKLGHMTLVQDLTCPIGLINLWRQNAGKRHIMSQVTHMVDTHYPGMLGKILLTSAPWALQRILNVLSPVLPARISEKIEIVPVTQTAQRMRELADPAKLPRFLGGDIADKDFTPTRVACTEDAGEELVVGAGKRDERGLPLDKGDVAAYGFTIDGEGQDIQFSVRFEPESGDIQQIQEPERVEEATGGTFTAPQKGRIVLVFDNSYSWINAKTVHFECTQLPPAEELVVTPAAS